jgi:hypothetical protein
MLRTALPACDDAPYRQVFKALLPFEKEEKKRVCAQCVLFFFLSSKMYSFCVRLTKSLSLFLTGN